MSAIVGAAGQIFSGEAQAKADNYNASVERQQADVGLTQSYIRGAQIDQQNARARGQQQAAYGASGVTGEGTPLAVMLDQATRGEMNRRLSLYQGQVDATGRYQQSDADAAAAKAARWGSYFNAGATLLTSAEKAASSGGYAGMKF